MTSSVTTSFLATIATSAGSSRIKSRAKRLPAKIFGGDFRIVSSLDFHCESTSAITSRERSGENGAGNLCGRGLVFVATLPYILPICSKAVEYSGSEYLILRQEIGKVLTKAKAVGVLRLVFDDAGTYAQNDNSGKFRLLKHALSWEILKKVKLKKMKLYQMLLELKQYLYVEVQPSVLQLGRIDSMKEPKCRIYRYKAVKIMREADPEGRLPEETLDASGLKQCFQRKGSSVQDLIALPGAHTLGRIDDRDWRDLFSLL